jgi:hypothetical protein
VTTRSNRSAGAGVLFAALAVLTACGDDGGGASEEHRRSVTSSVPTATVEPAEPSAEAAYRAWLTALESRDAAAACARHAPDFTIALRLEAILLHRAELGDPCVGFVAVLWEDKAREYRPTAIELTQLTEEDALLAVDFPTVDETVRMERRHGDWFVASTEPRDEDGADPARWVRSWCDLSVGMDRDEVIELMGTASGEYTVANGGEPQLWWADRQYDFRAYLDVDGAVLDLVGDYDRLEAADRDQLGCPELR